MGLDQQVYSMKQTKTELENWYQNTDQCNYEKTNDDIKITYSNFNSLLVEYNIKCIIGSYECCSFC